MTFYIPNESPENSAHDGGLNFKINLNIRIFLYETFYSSITGENSGYQGCIIEH
jgi:hypothetical protein